MDTGPAPRDPAPDPAGRERDPPTPIQPVDEKIGEGDDHLRARDEAWRKRHGDSRPPAPKKK